MIVAQRMCCIGARLSPCNVGTCAWGAAREALHYGSTLAATVSAKTTFASREPTALDDPTGATRRRRKVAHIGSLFLLSWSHLIARGPIQMAYLGYMNVRYFVQRN